MGYRNPLPPGSVPPDPRRLRAEPDRLDVKAARLRDEMIAAPPRSRQRRALKRAYLRAIGDNSRAGRRALELEVAVAELLRAWERDASGRGHCSSGTERAIERLKGLVR